MMILKNDPDDMMIFHDDIDVCVLMMMTLC